MQRRNLYIIGLAWLISIAVAGAAISTDQIKRLQNAAEVVRALRTQADNGIPENLWDKAECVAVIPGLKKAAFGVGGEYGKGVMSCRNNGRWSAPLFMQLAKGSWGLQIGATEIDLVLLVMNRDGADKLLSNKVALGADASAAAGPVGRAAAAGTDLQMRAEILSYSRARGVFAGIDISGGALGPDKDDNTDVYGADKNPKTIVFGNGRPVPEAEPFLKALAMPAAAASSRR